MSTVARVFETLGTRGEGALIGYIMAGDPSPEQTPLIADVLIQGGVDVLELGLPFSDPIADGPTIQAASVRALSAGTTPRMVLEMVQEIKLKHNTPIVVMTYYNPVFKMGLQRFFSLAKACRVDGVIVPDLPIEEATEYVGTARAKEVDTIFLAAPSTSAERLQKIIARTSGFLYLISRFGVTGARETVEDSTLQLIKRVLPFTKGHIPLAVGFGVSRPEHARSIIGAGANGVIVGSAFVNVIQKNQGNIPAIIEQVGKLAQKFKAATIH